jgi:hypothetical protein
VGIVTDAKAYFHLNKMDIGKKTKGEWSDLIFSLIS